jgi:hypothetical protein
VTVRRFIFGLIGAAAVLAVVFLIAPNAISAQDASAGASQPQAEARSPFRVLDVYVDSGANPLAAYQFEFDTTQKAAGELKLVGIEGGESEAFKEPPRYDPRALAQKTPRVIIAAFNTGKDLPTGRTRVARLMVRVSPGAALPPELEGHLTAAATPDAKPIAGAKLQIVEGAKP